MDKKEGGKMKMGENDLGIAGFTLGILSIIFAGGIGVITSIVGFFLCLSQQRKHKTKAGKVGMILNIIGFVIGMAVIVISLYYLGPLLEQLQTFPAI